MHKLLHKVSNLLILFCCLHGAVLSAAYASFELHEYLEKSYSTLDLTAESLSVQREGMHHARFGLLAPSLIGIISETENESHRDMCALACSLSSWNGAGWYADPFAQCNPAPVTFPFRNRSIYLLDCSFLI